MKETRIDLLRHGALFGGVRYRGSIEAELTPEGRADMDAVWERLCGNVDVIVSSPLSRCREPAMAWADGANLPCRIVDDLREMHYGAWEGLAADEIEAAFPGMLPRWRKNPVGMRIPQAETMDEFAARIIAAWEGILTAYAGQRILLLGHSGTLRVILTHAIGAQLETTRRFAMPYAGWSRVCVEGGRSVLSGLNLQA